MFGPMPDKKHVLVAQDTYSKFPAAKILGKTDASHVTKALDEIYATYGSPLIHRTDNGPPFNSEQFEKFSKSRGIMHETSFPYHPQANPAESFMKPLGKTMKAAYSQNLDKKATLDDFLATYRATPHTSTGLAPGDVLFRHGFGRDFPKRRTIDDDEVRTAVEKAQMARQERDEELNLTRRREEYSVGDQILTRNNTRNKFDQNLDPIL